MHDAQRTSSLEFLKRKSFSEADKDLAELSKIHDIEGRIMRVSLRVEFDYQLDKVDKELEYTLKYAVDSSDRRRIGEIYFNLGKLHKSQEILEKVICEDEINTEKLFRRLRDSKSKITVDTVDNFINSLKVKKSNCS